MEKRIVRLEDAFWHIRTDTGELSDPEQRELRDYFNEIRLPYNMVNGCLCIVGGVDRATVFERLIHFYDGRAEIFPF